MSKKKEQHNCHILVTRGMIEDILNEIDSKLANTDVDDHYRNTDKEIIYTLTQHADHSIHCEFDYEVSCRVDDEFTVDAENID